MMKHLKLSTSILAVRALAVFMACGVVCAFPTLLKGDGPIDSNQLIQDEESIDPEAFIEAVIDRYRSLRRYVEEADVHQETFDEACSEKLIDLRIRVRAEILNGRLEVERPGLGDDVVRLVLEEDEPASAADLLLLPHMQFYFADEPLRALRRGIDKGFEAWNVETVRLEDKPLVQVQLRSIEDDPEANPEATFDFFIDPEEMLVERIEGRHSLGKGLIQSITVDIDRLHAFFENEASDVTVEPKGDATPSSKLNVSPTKGS